MVIIGKSFTRRLFLVLLTLTAIAAQAGNTLRVTTDGNGFPVVAGKRAAAVSVSTKEPAVVKRAAALLADDIQRVTGIRPAVTEKTKAPSVIVATIGNNSYVDKLIAKGRLDVKAINGGWEQFVIRQMDNQLFIIGSDRRGTAYGVFTLSEKIGVSPWYWWADVPVAQKESIYVTAEYTSHSPSVKYRGIFINDEDWGLKPWATNNYEKELGDIGPRTYARVCELLLRLKANMLAPAMHSCTGAFYSHKESMAVADSFGVIITTSHCEPLLLNNAAQSEWDQERDGDWNYKTNAETIRKKWDERLSEAARYENIYTVAMRGLHDAGLRGNLPMEERVPLIQQVISDQRALLEKHNAFTPLSASKGVSPSIASKGVSPSIASKGVSPSIASKGVSRFARDIPQIFVPYKETMDIYEHGLQVPDDITLVWVDDNYGYMKRVSNPDEQKRSGRAGVYYHLSYLGAPHDYLWLNTTPPVLMYEELKKAYDHGADRYWLLNVGDIKPMELGMQTFFDMAWDFSAFDIHNVNSHQAAYLSTLFPTAPNSCGNTNTAHVCCDNTNNDYNSCSSTNNTHACCDSAATNSLRQACQHILDDYYRLAWSRKPEFMGFEYQWDDKAHTGLKDTEFSFRHYDEAQRRLADYQRISDEAEALASRVVSGSPADSRHPSPADSRLYAPTTTPSPADSRAAAFFELLQFPVQAAYQMNRKFLMAQLNHELAAEGRYAEANWAARQMWQAYDSINALNRRYNELLGGKWSGMMALSTSFTPTCEYYKKPDVIYTPGAGERRVMLTPLRGNQHQGYEVINLSKLIVTRTVQTTGQNGLPIKILKPSANLIHGIGYDWVAVQLGSPAAPPVSPRGKAELPKVSYRFNGNQRDSVDIVLYTVPFWPLYAGLSNRVGVSVDGSEMQVFENKFKEYDRTWKDQVMRNGISCRMRFAVDKKKARHEVTLHGIDPGQMVQRIVIDWGGLQTAYIP